MSPNPYSLKIYSLIQKRNKHKTVTADSMFENKTTKTSEKISKAIHELQAEGLITIKTILSHGKFATELIPAEGYIQHAVVKARLGMEEDDEGEEGKVPLPPKRKYQRRTVRRSLV